MNDEKTGRGWLAPVGVLIGPIVLLIAWLAVGGEQLLSGCERSTDHELIALGVEQAKQFNTFTGAYSRFGFRHPGPLFQYVLAFSEPLVWFAKTPDGAFRFTTLCLNLGLLISCLLLAQRFIAGAWAASLFFVLLLLAIAPEKGFLLHDYWNPKVTVVAMAALLWSGAATIEGCWLSAIIFVFSATLLVQAHVGTLPVVGPLLLAVGLGAYRSLQTKRVSIDRRGKKLFGGAILFGVILWLPVAWEALSRPQGGNLGAIVQFATRGEGGVSLWRAFVFTASFFQKPLGSWMPFSREITFALCLVIPCFVWREPERLLRRLHLLCCLAAVFAVIAATRVQGELYRHILLYVYGIVAVAYFLCSIVFVHLLQRVTKKLIKHHGVGWSGTLGSMMLAVLCALMVSKDLGQRARSCDKVERYRKYVDALQLRPNESVKISLDDHDAYPFAAGVVLQMARLGFRPCVQQNRDFLFGYGLTCESQGIQPTKQARFYLVRSDNSHRAHDRLQDGHVVMRWEPPTPR